MTAGWCARTTRAAVFAAVCVLLAALGHVLMSGSTVPWWIASAERAQPRGPPGFDDGVALLDLLDALPPERRQAFVLTQLAGLPYEEAAEAGGCPVGTIRSRVARARATLVTLLAEAEAEAEAGNPGAPSERAVSG